MLIRFCKFAILLLLVACVSVLDDVDAQSIGGSIMGVVKDATGPVPQAEVRIKNVATGQSRFWLTDDEGRYELREVPPGSYELEVSKDGYATFSTPPSKGLHLTLAQVASVDDITLRVAPVQETMVEVKAVDVAMTNSNTATLGTAFDESQVHALPLSARDTNNLGPLAMGVADVSSFSFSNTLVAFAVSGSRGRDNNFIIDSVDNNDPLFGGAATQFTNNAIFSEFRILTGQFQAEYGRNSGSIVNVISRQGQRDVHGSLFWFGQNDGLNAMTKVEKQSGLTKPARFYENQIGATVSGPVRRNSSWFFLSYQWDRARNDLSSQYPVIVTIPTPNGLALLKTVNDMTPSPTLSALLADPIVSTLPSLHSPCGISANSVAIPSNAERCQTNLLFLQTPSLSIPIGTYVVPRANVTDLHDHQGFARIDQKIGERNNLFARYLLDDFRIPLAPSSSPAAVGFSDTGLLPEWRNILAERTQNFGLAWTNASNRALNEFRLAYSRISSRNGALGVNSQRAKEPAITLLGTGLDASAKPSDSLGGLTLGQDSQPTQFNNNVYQLQENYSFVHGVHSLKLGVNFNETRSGLSQVPGDLGHYYYQDFQQFVDNRASFGSLRFGNFDGRGGRVLPLREFAQFYFAQDDIRISSNFTLNVGLRYESSNPSLNTVVERSAPYSIGQPKIDRVYTNFAPRLGFAWGLGQHTVIRGGYGIFYNTTFLDIALLGWQSGPISPYVNDSAAFPVPLGSYPNLPFTSSTVTFQSNLDCQGNPLPAGATEAPFINCTIQNIASRNLRNPFVHNASLGMQTQIRRDMLIEASYFGSRGTRLFQRLDLNPVNLDIDPNCQSTVCFQHKLTTRGIVTEITNGAFSNYNALQLSATKRFRSGSPWDGLTLSSAYTWSHMIDNASEVFGSNALEQVARPTQGQLISMELSPDPDPFAQDPQNTREGEKGNSSFDRRHHLALSFLWALPSPPTKARVLLGNWEVAGIFTAQSGQPFSPLNGINSCSLASLGQKRPNVSNPHAPANTVALINNKLCLDPASTDPVTQDQVRLLPRVPGAGLYITPFGQTVDPSTVRFVEVPFLTPFGDAGRNVLTGPGSRNLDLSLLRRIPLGERLKLQLRVEIFDLFNRKNPSFFAGNPFIAGDQRVSSSAFGKTECCVRETHARLGGLTPENVLDGGIVFDPSPLQTDATFYSQKYLTTTSRRIQWSVTLSF